MKSVTTVLEDWLVAQGMHDRAAGTAMVMGKDAGLPKGERTDPLADAAAGGPRIRSGMGKGTPAETGASQQGGNVRLGQSRSPVLRVHVNANVPTSTRKRTQQVPFLVVVK
jgi:hypothetical protein